jgi:flavodoxin
MKNIAVVYATRTKHSQKYAEAIAAALGVRAQNVTEHPQARPLALLILVGGIYGGKCHPALAEYAESLDGTLIQKAALVTSSASKRASQTAISEILEQKGISVAEELRCPGNFLFLRAGHPNSGDLKDAAGFGVRLSAACPDVTP